jgi:hypothetical protein
VLIRTTAACRDDLHHYLLRLGCVVEVLDDEVLAARVPHPDAESDERGSLEEWCRAWTTSSREAGRLADLATA